jgi:hypothetical protein
MATTKKPSIATPNAAAGLWLPSAGGSVPAWRDDAEHRVAQQRGRDAFYSEYSISVCQELGRRNFQTERKP